MNLRTAFLPFALALLLTACGGSGAPEATPTAAPAPATEAPAEAQAEPTGDAPGADPAELPSEADTPAEADDATAADAGAPAEAQPVADARPLPGTVTPVPGLVSGQDYLPIPGGQPMEPANGKIEVAEVFAYWCGACAQFDPLLEGWVARLPQDVRFTYVPAVFDPRDSYPKAYYAAEALGIGKRTHAGFFRGIHLERKLKPNASAQEIAAFQAGLGTGVDEKTFLSTMDSFAVNGSLSRARQFAARSQVQGTPAIVVNGRYLISPRTSYEDMLKVVDTVIAHERASLR